MARAGFTLFLCLLIAWPWGSAAYGGGSATLAVLELVGERVEIGDVESMAEQLRDGLAETGLYVVVDRRSMDERLAGEELAQRCDRADCGMYLGRIAEVDWVVAGRVEDIGGGRLSLTARLVDVAGGRLRRTVARPVKRKDLRDEMRKVTRELAGLEKKEGGRSAFWLFLAGAAGVGAFLYFKATAGEVEPLAEEGAAEIVGTFPAEAP